MALCSPHRRIERGMELWEQHFSLLSSQHALVASSSSAVVLLGIWFIRPSNSTRPGATSARPMRSAINSVFYGAARLLVPLLTFTKPCGRGGAHWVRSEATAEHYLCPAFTTSCGDGFPLLLHNVCPARARACLVPVEEGRLLLRHDTEPLYVSRPARGRAG